MSAASTTSGVTYSWVGPGGFTAAAATAVISNARTTASGTYAVRVLNASAACAFTALAYVSVNALPTITSISGSNPATCNGTSGALSISGLTALTTYTVSYLKGTVPQSTTGASNASGVLTVNGLGHGSYSSFVVTLNGCSSTGFAGPVTLSDPLPPLAPVAGSNSPVCESAALNLTATGQAGATFSWTGPNNFSSVSATPSVTGMTSANAGTYSVTQTVAGCVSPAATTVVAVTALPAQPGTITGPASPCINSINAYSISAVPTAASYTWTIPASWAGTSSGISINATTGTSSGTISVAAVNGCGTGPARSLTVTANNVPAASGAITGPTAICSGTATTYAIATVSNASGYTWVLPSGWSGTSTTNSIIATPDASSGVVYVIPTNVCGSGNSQSVAVSVSSMPATPGAITGPASACVGTTQLYYIAGVPGATGYTWSYPSGGNPAWSGATTGTSVNLALGANSGTVRVTAGNQCGNSAPQTLAVAVTNLPASAGAISGPAVHCVGSVETYSIPAVANATSYIWSVPASWSGSSNSNSIAVTAGTGSGSVTVTPVGLCGNGTRAAISVSGTPVVTPTVQLIRSTPSDTVCGGTPVTFTAKTTNAGNNPVYTFRRNGVLVKTGSADTFRTSALNSGDRISVTMISSLPCVSQSMVQVSDSLRMIVLPVRTPGININTQPPTMLCEGQTVTLQSNDTNGGPNPRYEWYVNGGRIPGVNTPNYTPSVIHIRDTFQVILTSDVVCAKFTVAASNKIGFSIAPVVVPAVSIVVDPGGPVTRGTLLTFTATHSNGGSAPSYQWLRNGSDISGATGSTWTSSTLAPGDEISVRLFSDVSCATPKLVTSNVIRLEIGTTGIAGSAGAFKGSARLYPNPNTGRFAVEIKGMTHATGGRCGIDVLNALGQTVYRRSFLPDRADWSHDVWLNDGLANGTYLLRISSDHSGAVAIPFMLNR